jgi:hypothetical protein
MRIVTAATVCLLILVSLYLIAEYLWTQRLGFDWLHQWGISQGIEVKLLVLGVTLVLVIGLVILRSDEWIASRRAQKEQRESEKE